MNDIRDCSALAFAVGSTVANCPELVRAVGSFLAGSSALALAVVFRLTGADSPELVRAVESISNGAIALALAVGSTFGPNGGFTPDLGALTPVSVSASGENVNSSFENPGALSARV
eukprot:8808146-Pyramimonas_sp.AAC.1